MAITFKKLISPVRLENASIVTLYTVPAATVTRVTELLLSNHSTVDKTVAIYFVPDAAAASSGNKMFPDLSLPGNTSMALKLDSVLTSGDIIAANAQTSNCINLHASGVQIT